MERVFWLAVYRAARTFLAALDGKQGAPTPEVAGRDAIKQVCAAIERRYDLPAKN
jgi:hypothetical protein